MPSNDPQPTLRTTESARLALAKETLGDDLSLEQFISRACEIAAETLKVSRCGVWLFVDDGAALRCVDLFDRARRAHRVGTTLRVVDFPVYFRNLRNRKVVSAEHAPSDPKTSELYECYFQPLSVISTLDAPIFMEGAVAGVICHEQTKNSREWTTEERDFAASMADLLAAKMKAAEIRQLRQVLRTNERRLAAMARSETIARMAVGVAHDFRNLLTAILTSGRLIVDSPAELPADVRTLANSIVQASNRAAQLAKELVDYGRTHAEHPITLLPQREIQRFYPVLKAAIGGRHELRLSLSDERNLVLMDRGQFDRAVMNLVLNARDAMPGGGTIELRVGASEGGEAGASHVVVAVKDHGMGMDAQTRDRIFEPFFTTKEQGSGLGLAIVERIVDDAGGYVEVESEPGQGTEMRLFLPIVGSEE